jgi:ribosomal protein L12E/L44/L45/RPP1/RPP2
MKDEKTRAAGGAPPDAEPFLQRWSRRKVLARQGGEAPDEAPESQPPVESSPVATGDATEAPELPDLGSLDANSDYSAFMAQGVDDSLRREALRKLFRSPKFNVLDGLDDYCEDFTKWTELGGIVTADMKFHLERAAKLAGEVLEDEAERGAAGAAAVATSPPASGSAPAEPQRQDEEGTEDHERTDRPA